MDAVKGAEAMGYDSIWTAEAYGSDAVTPAAWMLAQTSKIKVGTAIMQMPARSPAMAAMTAMSLAELSGGRFIMGVGASGPQVVEGWHGVPYGKPVTRLKEYVSIIKQIIAREGLATYDGKMYQMPYAGEGATGLGKPLKSILHCGEDIPIFAATITPAGAELEENVLRIAERVAKTPTDLQQINKRAVHRQMDAMGIRAGIRAGTEMQQLATYTATTQAHFKEMQKGLTHALSKRDEEFGDYRTGED
eukprot:g15821.t1